MSIYWIIAFVIYVVVTLQVIYFLNMKVVGYSALIKENKVNLNDLKVAQSEIISLKRQIENEKMSRRVDSISTKMQSHFQDILTEVTDEAEVALSAMAEDVKRVKKEKIKNVPVVKPLASTDEASSHMQVKRSKVPANFVENLAS